MLPLIRTYTSVSVDQTTAWARRIGSVLTAGDTLLLEGPIGAGKTHFARSLIQSKLTEPEDVPSPTFTLIQTYETPGCEIWHADLYRLNLVDEVVELGLSEAFDTAICLIEWPDRLGDLAPKSALHIALSMDVDDPDLRHMTFRAAPGTWSKLDGVI